MPLNRGIKRRHSSSEDEVSSTKFSSKVQFSKLNEYRLNKQLCDVTLRIKDTEFCAHKAVLAAFSPYFEVMFTGQFSESHQSTIEIKTIGADIMGIILEYAYCKSIDFDNSNVWSILQAADFLQVDPLAITCCNYLEEKLTEENCLSTWELANMHSSQYQRLRKNAERFAMCHFHKVSQVKDFLELDADAVIHFIKDDSLNVNKEEVVLEAITRWISHKQDERFPLLDKILSHVRLVFVDPAYLQDWVESMSLCKLSSCMKLIEETGKYHLLPSRRAEVIVSIRRNRDVSAHKEVLLIHGDTEVDLHCIDRDGVMVRFLKSPPDLSSYLMVSTYKNVILGGFLDKMWGYNYKAQNWLPIPPNVEPRYLFGLCELDGLWFSIGGRIVNRRHIHISNTVERYDPSTSAWTQVASIPVAVCRPAVVCHKGMIYVLGGLQEHGVACDLVQRYDPRHNTWVTVTTIPVPVKFPAACVLDGTIHLFSFSRNCRGGGRPIHYTYNLSTNQWFRKTFCFELLGGPVVMEGIIYVVAKYTDTRAIIKRYRHSTDSWDNFECVSNMKPKFFSGPAFLRSR